MFKFPKTGDDELDFIREASEEIFKARVKMSATGFGALLVGNGVLSGIIAIFSGTAALWIGGVLLVLTVLLGGMAALGLYAFRKEILDGTASQEALAVMTEAELYGM